MKILVIKDICNTRSFLSDLHTKIFLHTNLILDDNYYLVLCIFNFQLTLKVCSLRCNFADTRQTQTQPSFPRRNPPLLSSGPNEINNSRRSELLPGRLSQLWNQLVVIMLPPVSLWVITACLSSLSTSFAYSHVAQGQLSH